MKCIEHIFLFIIFYGNNQKKILIFRARVLLTCALRLTCLNKLRETTSMNKKEKQQAI